METYKAKSHENLPCQNFSLLKLVRILEALVSNMSTAHCQMSLALLKRKKVLSPVEREREESESGKTVTNLSEGIRTKWEGGEIIFTATAAYRQLVQFLIIPI